MKKTVEEKWCGMRINFYGFWNFSLLYHKLLFKTKFLMMWLKSDFYFTGLGGVWDSVFVRGSQEILMKLVTEIDIAQKCVKVMLSKVCCLWSNSIKLRLFVNIPSWNLVFSWYSSCHILIQCPLQPDKFLAEQTSSFYIPQVPVWAIPIFLHLLEADHLSSQLSCYYFISFGYKAQMSLCLFTHICIWLL